MQVAREKYTNDPVTLRSVNMISIVHLRLS